MITINDLINELNKFEDKNLPIYILLNNIKGAVDYNENDILDIVNINYNIENPNNINLCVEPKVWHRIEKEFEFHNYKIIIFVGKDETNKGYYFRIYENQTSTEIPIYTSVDDNKREDQGWQKELSASEFEAKLYVNNIIEFNNKTTEMKLNNENI